MENNISNSNNNTAPTTIDELAVMIYKHMARKDDLKSLATKEDLEEFRSEVNGRLDNLDARVARIQLDIEDMREDQVHRHEFEDALGRIKYMEKKLGIESGV